jgi:hypothetical protein
MNSIVLANEIDQHIQGEMMMVASGINTVGLVVTGSIQS